MRLCNQGNSAHLLFAKIFLQNTRESKTSQPCLHTLILTDLSTNESARSISVILYFFYHRRIARRKSIQQSRRCTLSLRRFFKRIRSLALIQVKLHSKSWNELWICEMKLTCEICWFVPLPLPKELDCWYSIWSMKSYGVLLFPSGGTSQYWGAIADFHPALLSISRLPSLFMVLGGKRLSERVKCVYSLPTTQRSNTT